MSQKLIIHKSLNPGIDGLVHYCGIFSADALEIPQSCTKFSIMKFSPKTHRLPQFAGVIFTNHV